MKMLKGAAGVAAIAAALAVTNASAVNLATDGIGEVAIAPFYTTRNNWSTLINLTNTSASPIVVKVRLHESLNSRDVLDFNVALSGNDVFTGRIKEGANGPVFEVVGDQNNAAGRGTCTIPSAVMNAGSAGTPLSTLGYVGTGNGAAYTGDNGPAGVDRMRDGYIEFIEMGVFAGDKFNAVRPTAGVAAAAINVINVGNAIEQHDCAALDLAFDDIANPLDAATNVNAAKGGAAQTYIEQTAKQAGEPINAVKFNARLLNGTRGVEAGGQVVTWANFYNPGNNAAFANAASTHKFTNQGDGLVLPSAPGAAVANTNNAACNITRGDERTQSSGAAGNFNWVPDGSDQTAAAARDRSCRNLVTAQKNFAFLEPSLNDAFPPIANMWIDAQNRASSIIPRQAGGAAPAAEATDNGLVATRESRGVDAVSLTIQRATIMNEWSTNPTLGVSTDWIATFPTKGLYVDRGGVNAGGQIISEQFGIVPASTTPASINRREADLAGTTDGFTATTFAAAPAAGTAVYNPFQSAWAGTFSNPAGVPQLDARSCDDFTFTLYDRAERTAAAGGVIVSPAPVGGVNRLCYEANVITFNDRSAFVAGSAAAANLPNRFDVNTSALTGVNAGWMSLGFVTQAQTPRLGGVDIALGNAGVGLNGKPIIGFNLKVRSFVGSNNVADNFASSVEHGYIRAF